METVITCPNCKTEIPLSDAFKHEIEAGVLATERARHQRDLDAAVKAAEIAAGKKAADGAVRRDAALQAVTGRSLPTIAALELPEAPTST